MMRINQFNTIAFRLSGCMKLQSMGRGPSETPPYIAHQLKYIEPFYESETENIFICCDQF